LALSSSAALLVALRSLAREVRSVDAAAADRLDRDAERIEAGGVEFARIRAAHLVASGAAKVRDGALAELDRLFLAATPPAALGLGSDADSAAIQSAALAAIERWRTRAGEPLADPSRREVCETAARTCEALYASVA
jgi:hypothetical protein